jgi:hypothetical protein
LPRAQSHRPNRISVWTISTDSAANLTSKCIMRSLTVENTIVLQIFEPERWAANRRARTRERADADLKIESGSGDDGSEEDAGPFGSFKVGCSAFLRARFSSSLLVVSRMISTCFNSARKSQVANLFHQIK